MSCCKQTSSEKKMIDKLGGWSIDKNLYEFITSNLLEGSTILELGSGYGTEVLSKKYKMYSIEHNEKFVGKYNSTYCYAPIKNGWYDVDSIKMWLDLFKPDYQLILIDGPTGEIGRGKFANHLNLFNSDGMMIFDDTNRDAERQLFNDVLHQTNFEFEVPETAITKRNYKIFEKFSVIYAL